MLAQGFRPARAAAVLASLLLLLFAQLLLVTHVHADDHGHGDEQADQLCAVCLFKAAGHEQLGPLKNGAAMALPRSPKSAAPAEPALLGSPHGERFRKLARGPPPALRLA